MTESKIRDFFSLPRGMIAVALLSLSSCGGGSSNSGGDSNIFFGTQEVRISQSRITSESISTDFQLRRSGNQITISDQDFTISAQLSGSQFSVSTPDIPIRDAGVGCSSFSVTYSGNITSTMVTGEIKGALNCPLPGNINGSFQASNQTNSSQPTLPSLYSIVVPGG